MEIKCAKCEKRFEYSKNDIKKYYMRLSFTNINKKNEMEFVICPHCKHENFIEEIMLLNKCGFCDGFLYEHIELETANCFIYCPKCQEEFEKIMREIEDNNA